MFPVNISFKDMDSSEFVAEAIQKRAEKLERLYDRIISCDVTLSEPHRRQQKGRQFHMKIHLGIPGKDLIVNREPGDREAHFDASVMIRDAFEALESQLREHVNRLRRKPKKDKHMPETTEFVEH